MSSSRTDHVVLRRRGAQATIDPHAGGRLASLEIEGDEILVTNAPRRVGHDWEWGCFPLAPWAGVQRGSAFTFNGRRHTLETDERGESWHGLVAERPWTVTRVGDAEADLEIAIGGRSQAPWFTPAVVRQRLRLTDSALHIHLGVDSPHEEMPVVLGLHPWFRRRLDGNREATVDFAPHNRLVGDPGGRIPSSDLGGRPWDDLFSDVDLPRIAWRDGPSIALESEASTWVYYDRAAEGFCIEPWTDEDDALSRTKGRAAPGQPATLELAITW